jgi:diadenosine tetraphosphate (Ap4A) HIT family hydrolase
VLPQHTPTLQAFVTERSYVCETEHWVIALRPKQPTLGALLLISKSDADSMAGLTAAETADLHNAYGKIDALYAATFFPDKVNYLALMMVDPNPHFHVIPRYAEKRAFDGGYFTDNGWPKLPDLNVDLDLNETQMDKLTATFRAAI